MGRRAHRSTGLLLQSRCANAAGCARPQSRSATTRAAKRRQRAEPAARHQPNAMRGWASKGRLPVAYPAAFASSLVVVYPA